MLTDPQLDRMWRRYNRARNGVHGTPPTWIIDLGNALQEIHELRQQVNQLVEEREQEN